MAEDQIAGMARLRTILCAMRQGSGLIFLLWKGASKVWVAERIFSRRKGFVMTGKATGFFVPPERPYGGGTIILNEYRFLLNSMIRLYTRQFGQQPVKV